MTLSRRTFLAALCSAAPLRSAPSEPLTLPARRNDFHQLLVPASIGNSPPLWCELDSGGGGHLVFIDADRARAIGVQPTFYGSSAGALEGAPSPDLRTRVTVAFPGLKFPAQEVVIKPGPLPGDKDASVGMLLFGRYVVELDHASPAVRLHDAASFRYSGPGRALPFTIEDNNPFTAATLTLRDGQQLAARMVIDTGAVGSIAYFSSSFATRSGCAEAGSSERRTTGTIDAQRAERAADPACGTGYQERSASSALAAKAAEGDAPRFASITMRATANNSPPAW